MTNDWDGLFFSCDEPFYRAMLRVGKVIFYPDRIEGPSVAAIQAAIYQTWPIASGSPPEFQQE